MRKQKKIRTRPQLSATTIRHLSTPELAPVVGASAPNVSDTRGVCTLPSASG